MQQMKITKMLLKFLFQVALDLKKKNVFSLTFQN